MLLRTLRLSVCAWNAPGLCSDYFQQTVHYGVGIAEFMEHILHELEADEVVDRSLANLLEFVFLSVSSYPHILVEKASVFLRCVIAACQRQHCSGEPTLIWPVTRLTLKLLG